jgi:hypothetical protein
MSSELEMLCADAIRRVLSDELSDHFTHGWGEYKMNKETIALVVRARALGIGPLEPHEGYPYLKRGEGEPNAETLSQLPANNEG